MYINPKTHAMTRDEFLIHVESLGYERTFAGKRYSIWRLQPGFRNDDKEKTPAVRLVDEANRQLLTFFSDFMGWCEGVAMVMMEQFGGKWTEEKAVDYVVSKARRIQVCWKYDYEYDPKLTHEPYADWDRYHRWGPER